jgi:hypothetical protein
MTTISLAMASTSLPGWRVLPGLAVFAFPMTCSDRFPAKSIRLSKIWLTNACAVGPASRPRGYCAKADAPMVSLQSAGTGGPCVFGIALTRRLRLDNFRIVDQSMQPKSQHWIWMTLAVLALAVISYLACRKLANALLNWG